MIAVHAHSVHIAQYGDHMLVYANAFKLQPTNGPTDIIFRLAKWASGKTNTDVRAKELAYGVARYETANHVAISTDVTTITENDERIWTYPLLWSMTLTHPDEEVKGRKWVAEFGLEQAASDKAVLFTIALNTEEDNAAVASLDMVTRPKIVEELLTHCNPINDTPGLKVKNLTQGDATKGYLNEIERLSRRHILVVVSKSESAPNNLAENIRTQVAGLADVIFIPSNIDTFALENTLGRDYIAFGGAIRLIYALPQRQTAERAWSKVFRPEEVQSMTALKGGIPSAILKAVTVTSNLRMLDQHIALSLVRGKRFALQMRALEAKLKSSNQQSSAQELKDLLQLASDLTQQSEQEVKRERIEREKAIEERDREQAKAEALEAQLKEQSDKSNAAHIWDEHQQNGINKAASVLNHPRPKLYDVLCTVASFFPEELIVLDSAYQSAKESDRSGFSKGRHAWDLLNKLGFKYARSLQNDETEQKAAESFGKNDFAWNEGNDLPSAAKSARTFVHDSQSIFMERHLKFGVKDSIAETLRIHFAWHSATRKVLIGHCGKHLNR
jgi:hypothetical protein